MIKILLKLTLVTAVTVMSISCAEDTMESEAGAEATAAAPNLVDFCKVITAVTGEPCLKYNNYGCWCGRGGSGTPVDGLDSCCKTHDACYDNAPSGCNCGGFGGNSHYKFTNSGSGMVTCDPGQSACAQFCCECDVTAANCFAGEPYGDDAGVKPECPKQDAGTRRPADAPATGRL